jgi:hypothetical protein
MTMIQFCAAARIGHSNRLKWIYGYLQKFARAAVQVRLLESDLGELPDLGATVYMAMLNSLFTAAQIAVYQIFDVRATLQYLGVPVHHKSYMFGDNQAVVMNSSIPHSSLNKRHNTLSYHRVKEMIAATILGFYWIDGKFNPASITS